MTVEIIDHTTGTDRPPIDQMEKVVDHFVWQVTHAWPGGVRVANDLRKQGFYIELVDELPEAPGALGYHSVDENGRPFSKVAKQPSFDAGSDWLTGLYSVNAVVEHEYAETIGNPLVDLWVDRDRKSEVARELGDPVQDQTYRRHGADNSNFVLPAWFNPWAPPPYDFLGSLSRPFELSSGGYCIVRTTGSERDEWHATREEGSGGARALSALTRGRILLGR
jgi:hypothetical protein